MDDSNKSNECNSDNRAENDDLKKGLTKAWEKAKHLVRRGTEEVIKTTQIGKVKFDTTLLIRERAKLYQKLGEKSAALIRENKIAAPELNVILAEIEVLNQKIEKETERVSRILNKNDEGC